MRLPTTREKYTIVKNLLTFGMDKKTVCENIKISISTVKRIYISSDYKDYRTKRFVGALKYRKTQSQPISDFLIDGLKGFQLNNFSSETKSRLIELRDSLTAIIESI